MYQEKKERELREVCAELGLDAEVSNAIFYFATVRIREFERKEKPDLKSAAKRAASLAHVEELSRELESEIWALDGLDRVELGQYIEDKTAIRIHLDPPDRLDVLAENSPGFLHVLRVCDALLCVAEAAKVVNELVPDGSQKGGRIKTRERYADFVWTIADFVSEIGIQPGRGGPFERLCKAVFSAGDVSSEPVNAIRHFMTHRFELWKEIQARMAVSEGHDSGETALTVRTTQ